jgi:cell division protein FtsB
MPPNSFFPTGKAFKRSFWSFLGFLLFSYFTLHLVQGERGYTALKNLRAEKSAAAAAYAALDAEKQQLQHRVELLRPPAIDEDMLDEQVRAKLGYLHPDEHVLPLSGNLY